MKFPWTLVALMLLLTSTLAKAATYKTNLTSWNAATEAEIKSRIDQLDLPLETVSNAQVITRVRQYILPGRRDTELILGRTVVYFPLFEHFLQKYNLPEELKYLPMIESGLRPTVKSGVGAAGMWQFMSVTARYNGLIVNEQVDQRLDPYASTEAAVKMLSLLYKQFGDWGLVLAAYNSGPGRVRKAVKLAGGSKDYWVVKQYLPQETQKYVPAFIAAAYVAQYYSHHGLSPNLSPTTSYAQDTRLISVVDKTISFNQIAKATGVDIRLIKKLNPAYIQQYIPGNGKNYNVVLPASATSAFRSLLKEKQAPVFDTPKEVPTIYVAAKGDSIEKVARMFNTTPEKIKAWNNLNSDDIMINQELLMLMTRSYLMKRA